MPIGADTFATRRHLPHLTKPDRTYFVTFVVSKRRELSFAERDVVFETCLYEHGTSSFVHCFIVMPDHVHMILAPYEFTTLSTVMQRIKSVSAHRVKKLFGIAPLWQDESFDRMIRRDEDLRKKCEYTCENAVRAGLVERVEDYRWVWREWVEGRVQRTGEGACPPLD